MNEKITTDKQNTRLSLEQHIARALKKKRISQGYKISDVARIADLAGFYVLCAASSDVEIAK